ncbi:hypothetical protein [Synechococcus sp. PCC 7336]|uniref:hypothetical protein n=1 Tax=Synechococcus sp. PCC 7336 TaxID=195250 RepID=UPI00034D1CF0|nr:hypothetical protein [Synechococcus sp. PCC 7336]
MRSWWLLSSLLLGLLLGGTAFAEDWAFFAAGEDGYRHYVDLESVRWQEDDPALVEAKFINTSRSDIYVVQHFCDARHPNYGLYLLDGASRSVQPESVVESSRQILCFSPCVLLQSSDGDAAPDRRPALAADFWQRHSCL